jgi:hypothetical protein
VVPSISLARSASFGALWRWGSLSDFGALAVPGSLIPFGALHPLWLASLGLVLLLVPGFARRFGCALVSVARSSRTVLSVPFGFAHASVVRSAHRARSSAWALSVEVARSAFLGLLCRRWLARSFWCRHILLGSLQLLGALNARGSLLSLGALQTCGSLWLFGALSPLGSLLCCWCRSFALARSCSLARSSDTARSVIWVLSRRLGSASRVRVLSQKMARSDPCGALSVWGSLVSLGALP